MIPARIRSVVGKARRQLKAATPTPAPRALRPRRGHDDLGPFIDAPPGWTAHLSTVRWLDGPRLELAGWAYTSGDAPPPRAVRLGLRLQRVDSSARIDAEVTRIRRAEVNAVARDPDHDRSRSAFVALFDLGGGLLPVVGDDAPQRWVARIELADPADADGALEGPFDRRDIDGSAGELRARALADGVQVLPVWVKGAGLVIQVVRPDVVADEFAVVGRTISGVLRDVAGFQPSRVDLLGDSGTKIGTAPLDASVGDASFAITLPPGNVPVRSLTLVAGAGRRHRPVHWARSAGLDVSGDDIAGPVVRCEGDGTVHVDDRPVDFCVDVVELVTDDGEPVVRIGGQWRGADPNDVSVTMVGPRQSVDARTLELGGGRVEVLVPVVGVGPWAQSGVTPLPGRYRLDLITADGLEVPARVTDTLADELPQRQRSPWIALTTARDRDGALALVVGGPLSVDETGAYAFGRLQRRYRKQLGAGAPALTDAVYFDSFAGKTANDNTRALHDEIHRRRPDLIRYWAVVDRSVPLPEGVIPVVHRSADWFAVLATSRYVVTNSWLPNVFRRRPGQVVLQAWHGSAFKKLGADRIGRGERYLERTREETAQWSFLVSQNAHTSDVFRRAYGYTGRILETGYPRDDVLSTDLGLDRRAATRAVLELPESERVILYAPTFRSRDAGMPVFDHVAILEALGPDTTILLRGHSSTTRKGADVRGHGIIDVTTYPEITDLYLAADVCITDYSSVMFDFTITGKPILFFVPDLAEYRDTMRGTYFDLGEVSPGPMLTTTDELVDALGSLPRVTAEFADRYRAWVERFNAWEVGHAAERVVDVLLGEGAKLSGEGARTT